MVFNGHCHLNLTLKKILVFVSSFDVKISVIVIVIVIFQSFIFFSHLSDLPLLVYFSSCLRHFFYCSCSILLSLLFLLFVFVFIMVVIFPPLLNLSFNFPWSCSSASHTSQYIFYCQYL